MKRRHEEASSKRKNSEQETSEAEGNIKEESPVHPGPSEGIKAENRKENENSSPSVYYSFSSSYCSASSPPKTDEKGCIYYIHVKTIKGVAVEWETETGMEPIQKAPRIYEMRSSEEGILQSPDQSLSREVPADMGKREEEPREEHKEEETTGLPKTAEERRRRKIPDWMVSTDSGLRCVACCRVFLTLEALRKHAKHGAREGFSCHVFNKKIHERLRAQKNLCQSREHVTQSPKDQSKPEDEGKGQQTEHHQQGKGRRTRTSRGTHSVDMHHNKDAE